MKFIFAGDWRAQIELRLKQLAENRGLAPLFVPLRNLAWTAVAIRNLMRPYEPYRAPIPVISVGNITFGGTGKTPFVKWLIKQLTEIGCCPAILIPLSESADEVREHESENLSRSQTCLVFSGRNRVTNVKKAVERGATVIVLDDGFQFRSLHRDVDILLWDATSQLFSGNPFLREPLNSLKRATCIVLSKADALSDEECKSLKVRLEDLAGQGKVVAAFGYKPIGVKPVRGGEPLRSENLPSKVLLVAGIANLRYFFLTAQRAGFKPVAMVCFPDHHRYTLSDAKFVSEVAETESADAILTTRKDTVKLQELWQSEIPLFVLEVELHWLWGEERLREIVEQSVLAGTNR